MSIKETITKQIKDNDVVLYMKGTPDFPQCGFSAGVSAVLKNLDVTFESVDVLAEDEIRQGIKDFSDWPTIPQLYVKGEFIGGADIVKEMLMAGDLQALLQEHNIIK